MEPLRKINDEESDKMKAIYSAFCDLIAESPNMEVFYSEKLGFIILYVDDLEGERLRPEVIDTAEEFYFMICNQIAMDVLYSLPDSPDYLWELSEADRQRILDKIESDAAIFPEYARVIEELFEDHR